MKDWAFEPFSDEFETDPEPYVPTVIEKPKRRPSGSSARRREYMRPDPSDSKAYALWTASTPPTSAARIAEELVSWYGATCQLCREPIDMTLAGHHPGRWNVDHIRPRAKGGTNTWGNLQLVHRCCNGIKSHGVLPEPPSWLYGELCRASIARFEIGGKPKLSRFEKLRLTATDKVADVEKVKKIIQLSREQGIPAPPGMALSRRKAIAAEAISKVEKYQNRLIAKHDAAIR